MTAQSDQGSFPQAEIPTASGVMGNAQLAASLQAYALGIRLFGLARITEMMATNSVGTQRSEVSSNTPPIHPKGEDQ